MNILTEILILLLPILAASLVANFKFIKELREQDLRIRMYESERWREIYEKKRVVKFINTDTAGDNETMNRKVQELLDKGYAYIKSESTDKMLAFVKYEEIKGD